MEATKIGNYFDPEERIDWELQKEQQKQKNIARNATKKPKRSGCRLPSDYLTNKQKQDLNGEVKIMNMNAPVAYKAFRMWPKDIQEQYLRGLVEKFHVSQKEVAEMMGVSLTCLSRFCTDHKLLGIFPRVGKGRVMFRAGWEAFCQNGSVSLEKPAGETNSVSEGSEPVSENASESLENARSETEEEKHNRVIRLLEAGTITVADAEEMLGKKVHVSENKEISTLTETENGDILQHWENAPAQKTKRHSGRYPWGEGCEDKTPEEWIAKIRDLEETGKSDKEIADILGMKKLEFQDLMRIAYKERKDRERMLDLDITSLVVQIHDLDNWEELFKMLRAMKLPKENYVYFELKENIRPKQVDFSRYGGYRRGYDPDPYPHDDDVDSDEEE